MNKKQKRLLVRIIISGAIFLSAFITFKVIDVAWYIQLPCYLLSYFTVGYDVLKKAFLGIVRGKPFSENFLMSVASIGAFCLKEFPESVAVMLFYQVGELFQSIAVGKSRKRITDLIDVRPEYVNLKTENGISEVEPEAVPLGSIIVVKNGEKIAIDGVIVKGETFIDSAMLSGESIPEKKCVGDMVLSGSVNRSSVIEVKTEKEFSDSTASKILELVEESSMRKSRSENFISVFAKYYTPIVCALAVLLAVAPPILQILTGQAPLWSEYIKRALTFLVISCPCALVISIPLSFFGGIGSASRNGILVKGSNYLESMAKINNIVMDKTGTVTKGVFKIFGIYPVGCSEEKLKTIVYSIERNSDHPIAKSITEYCDGGKFLELSEVKEVAGKGLIGVYEGKRITVGNEKLMHDNGIKTDGEVYGKTTVFIAEDDKYLGKVVISDVIKPSAVSAIEKFKNNKISVTMLSGDDKQSVEAVAKEVGIENYEGKLLPADKLNRIEEIIKDNEKGKKVAFVGDGINDAPVLMRSDVGISMGTLGSDAAIEASDVVIMDDDLNKIEKGIRISKKTLLIAKENVIFSLAVKIACLILGGFGIATMWLAVFSDVGVMILAVLNAVRTTRFLENKKA